LGGLARFERNLIKARTDVGIKRARARHPLRSAAKAYKAQAPWRISANHQSMLIPAPWQRLLSPRGGGDARGVAR
jgi:hypothetical protein